eukprot:TRINITY_DN10707_c0_g1_i1.p1 TRINITY_DN10707_c0_g1~~TRINITY_DN10707_c0_g1_i1.p1  ORF type:complete len:554 (+),score=121.89 TRINITY_DN10707_c0_g1_i1:69-1664(+)
MAAAGEGAQPDTSRRLFDAIAAARQEVERSRAVLAAHLATPPPVPASPPVSVGAHRLSGAAGGSAPPSLRPASPEKAAPAAAAEDLLELEAAEAAVRAADAAMSEALRSADAPELPPLPAPGAAAARGAPSVLAASGCLSLSSPETAVPAAPQPPARPPPRLPWDSAPRLPWDSAPRLPWDSAPAVSPQAGEDDGCGRRPSAPLWMPQLEGAPPSAAAAAAAAARDASRHSVDALLAHLGARAAASSPALGRASSPLRARGEVAGSPPRQEAPGGAGRLGSPPRGTCVSPPASPNRGAHAAGDGEPPADPAEVARLREAIAERDAAIRDRETQLTAALAEAAQLRRELAAVQQSAQSMQVMMRRDFAQKKAALLLRLGEEASSAALSVRSASPAAAAPQASPTAAPAAADGPRAARRGFSRRAAEQPAAVAPPPRRLPRSFAAAEDAQPVGTEAGVGPSAAPRRSVTPQPKCAACDDTRGRRASAQTSGTRRSRSRESASSVEPPQRPPPAAAQRRPSASPQPPPKAPWVR